MTFTNSQILLDNIENLVDRVSEIAGYDFITFTLTQYKAKSFEDLKDSDLESVFNTFQAIAESGIY